MIRLGYATQTSAKRFVKTMRPETETLRHLAIENDERIWNVREVSETADALGADVPPLAEEENRA